MNVFHNKILILCFILRFFQVICFAGFLAITIASTSINSHLSSADLERLQNVFNDGLASNDLQSIYYSVLNTKLDDISASNKQNICKKIVDLHKDSKLNVFQILLLTNEFLREFVFVFFRISKRISILLPYWTN